jgi:uncharacterized protein YcfJ
MRINHCFYDNFADRANLITLKTMKPRCLALSLLAVVACHQANAADLYDYAAVISTSPVYVANAPKRVCTTITPEEGNAGTSVTGVVIGGIAGGLLGNTVGKGNGKTAAAAIGAVTGALAGNAIANNQNQPQSQPKQTCQMVSDGSTHITAYDVTYEYSGKRASVRLQRDPGPTIRVGITAIPQI